jgi:hypothetical protein
MIKLDTLTHTRELYMNDSHINREAKEEHFKYCTFLTVDFTEFDCEDAFFYGCLFLNCLMPENIHHGCMNKCYVVGSVPDEETPSV